MVLAEWVTYLHYFVGAGYTAFAILVILVWGRELLKWFIPQTSRIKVFIGLAMLGTFTFLLACGEHHFHMGYHVWAEPELFDREFLVHMLWDSLLQAVAVWGPIGLIFYTRRLFIRLGRKAQDDG